MRRCCSTLVGISLFMVLSGTGLAEDGGSSVMEGYGPLTEAQRTLFRGSVEDAPAEKLLATEERLEGRHYPTCDEWYIHLFEPKLRGLGGGYLGVGTDQAYLLIGWQKPHLAWLFDYDPWVKYIHRTYHIFFEEAETIDEFLALWAKKNRKASRKLLQEKLEGDKDGRTILRVWKANRSTVERRLNRVIKKLKKAGVASYLSDPEIYKFVRQLVLNGRVRPMVGDLLKEQGLVGVGKVSRELGIPLRAMYLSNAEGYWAYSTQFRENIKAQNFDEKSLVLRTVAAKWTNGDYRYNMQPGTNFQLHMEKDFIKSFKHIVPMGKLKGMGDIPLTVTDGEPKEPRKKKMKKKKKKKKKN